MRGRDAWAGPPPGMFRMTTDPEDAPSEPERGTVRFERGKFLLRRLDLVQKLPFFYRLICAHDVTLVPRSPPSQPGSVSE